MIEPNKMKDYFKTAITGISPSSIQTAAKNLGIQESMDLSDIVIPLTADDPNVEKIIRDLGLQNPRNMIKFLVEAHFAQFACIYEGISDLKKLDLYNSLAKVNAAGNEYIRGLENPDDKKTFLMSAMHDLSGAFSELEIKLMDEYIAKVRRVDKERSNAALRVVKSIFNIINVSSSTKNAKMAVNAIIETVNLQALISAELGVNISGSVIAPFESFRSRLLEENACELMDSYEKDPKEEFWQKLPDRLNNISDAANKLEIMLETADEEDLDFDNILFN